MPPLLEVGLTGGIAAGKSQVLAGLAAAGCHTLDLDRVAHAVMAPGGSAYDDVVAAFGPRILAPGGAIDRGVLGQIVFADDEARQRLGALVHPRVREEQRERARQLAAGPGGVLVVDAALLVETGMHLRFDRLVVVDVEPGEQLRRLRQRDGLSEAQARLRLEAQMPVTEKRRFAHLLVDTSGGLAETRSAAGRLALQLRRLADSPPRAVDIERERIEAALAAGPDRGRLPPASLLVSLAEADGPALPDLARTLRPTSGDPWHAARDGNPIEALALAVPVAIWSLALRGQDPEHQAGAAWSLARLCGVDGDDAAALVLTALAAAGGAARRDLAAAWRDDQGDWLSEAERWTGCRVPPPAPLSAALAHATAPEEARAAAGDERLGAVAAALVALATGASDRAPGEAARRAAASAADLRAPE